MGIHFDPVDIGFFYSSHDIGTIPENGESLSIMARPIKNINAGVAVKITPENSRKVQRITKKTHRTFATEVNVGVEQYADKTISKFKDNGK